MSVKTIIKDRILAMLLLGFAFLNSGGCNTPLPPEIKEILLTCPNYPGPGNIDYSLPNTDPSSPNYDIPAICELADFQDSAVHNLLYTTETQSAFTNPNGEFYHLAGETVTFSIGDIVLPSSLISALMTPLNLAQSVDMEDPVVVNIARFLQTLDADTNPGNGIKIPNAAHTLAAGISINFNQSVADFESDPVVTNYINAVTSPAVLTPELDALQHFTTVVGEVTNLWPTIVSVGQEVRVTGNYMQFSDIVIDGIDVPYTLRAEHEIRFNAPDLPPGPHTLTLKYMPSVSLTLTYQLYLEATQIVTGKNHSCALLEDGRIRCWGGNHQGQLGDGSLTQSNSPTTVNGITTATAVFTGDDRSCAVLTSGEVQCWGRKTAVLPDGTLTYSSVPVTVKDSSGTGNLSGVAEIVSGYAHTCARLTDGTVQCWGSNWLGTGVPGLGSPIPLVVRNSADSGPLTNIVAITAGHSHSCVLLGDNGGVQCWGLYGGSTGGGLWQISTLPVPIQDLQNSVKAMGSGDDHDCAVLTDNRVQCWGDGTWGQLGDGGNTSPPAGTAGSPFTLGNNETIDSLVGGWYHSCALLENSTVYCWGWTRKGQLGNGVDGVVSTPVQVSDISTAQAIAGGWEHNCALLNDSNVQCWGINDNGQLGTDTTQHSPTPVTVGMGSVQSFDAGETHNCAILANSSALQCWGNNRWGQLGDGLPVSTNTPVAVSGNLVAQSVSSGGNHSCVVVSGSVQCWGGKIGEGFAANFPKVAENGFLGDGLTSNSATPVTVIGVSTAETVSVGIGHACALLADKTVECWGSNAYNQLGDGGNNNPSTNTAEPVVDSSGTGYLSGVESISVNGYHSCALLSDGSVQCWGRNNGEQLGQGGVESSSIPMPVPGISNATAISASGSLYSYSSSHTCALLSSGSIQCWGNNNRGQLGRGNSGGNAVVGITNAVAISAGSVHSCAVLDDFTVHCWGGNEFGALGNGTTIDSDVPMQVIGVVDAIAISVGKEHSCALLDDGVIQCWGQNDSGQLALPPPPSVPFFKVKAP